MLLEMNTNNYISKQDVKITSINTPYGIMNGVETGNYFVSI